MKATTRLSIALLFVFICVMSASAQIDEGSPPDSELSARAKIIFTRLLESEQKADSFVTDLHLYCLESPWHYAVILGLSQRLIVGRFETTDVVSLLRASGDAAAALGGDEETFARIVLTMADLKTDKEAYPNLTALQRLGIPVLKLLGEATGKKEREIELLAMNDRLNASGVYRILKDMFARNYGGLAEKLAKERDKEK